MKTVYTTFVSNYKEIGYHVPFLVAEMPSLKVFCGNAEDKEYLLKDGIESTVIDFVIKDRFDIAKAQNICLDKIFEDETVGFAVWQQADLYLTDEAYSIINGFCTIDNIGKSIDFKVRDIRLFHLCKSNHYGALCIGRDCKQRFVGDGAYVNDYTTKGSDDCCIHIGYLSIDDFRKHINKNKETFKSPVTIPEDDGKFVEEIISRNYMDIEGFISEGSIAYDLIVKMGLKKELEKVEDIMYICNIKNQIEA